MFRRTPGNLPQPDEKDMQKTIMNLYSYVRTLEDHINNLVDILNSTFAGGGKNVK